MTGNVHVKHILFNTIQKLLMIKQIVKILKTISPNAQVVKSLPKVALAGSRDGQGWRSGETARLRHQCGLGSNPEVDPIYGLRLLLVIVSSKGFRRVLRLSSAPSTKTNISKVPIRPENSEKLRRYTTANFH